MTLTNAKHFVMYDEIDEHDNRPVSSVAYITVSVAGNVHVGTYLLFYGAHIHTGKRRGYGPRGGQRRRSPRKYRTKTEGRQLGKGAFNILEKHREDMADTPDSLTTDFAIDWISGFKRER